MRKRTLPITLGAMLVCGYTVQTQAQVSAGVKLEAKAGADVSGANSAKANSAKAKLEAKKNATATARVKANAQGSKAAALRANIKAPKFRPPTANIRPYMHMEKNFEAQAKGTPGTGAKPSLRAKAQANANAPFKIPPPGARMALYGEGYAKLSPAEKTRARSERRQARWTAFRAKHQSKITVERPKLLAPTFRAEFKLNAQRIAKLQRIRFLAQGKGQANLVAKADMLMEKENERHTTELASLVEGKSEAKVTGDLKAQGSAHANANSAVKKPEGN